MAQQGLDQTFGLLGTCTSHVSGFGGWPLGVVAGIDGRPTLICSAPAQRPLDQLLTPGGRVRAEPLDTPTVVSFPPDGRPRVANGIHTFKPEANSPFRLARAAVLPDRVAVLGSVPGGLATLEFSAGRLVSTGGVHREWKAGETRRVLRRADPLGCGLCWVGADLVVVGSLGLTASGLRLFVDVAGANRELVVPLPLLRNRLDLTRRGMRVVAEVTSVCADADRGLLVGVTLAGLDRKKGHDRPTRAVDEGRAMVVRLVGASLLGRLEPDPDFGDAGVWLTGNADGEITTADHLALSEDSLMLVGRASREGVRSLFAACLDARSGQAIWTAYPGEGVLQQASGIASDSQGRLFACGATQAFDPGSLPDARVESAVCCLLADGQPDPSFGIDGVARFRLNGATYATALHVTGTGDVLIASLLRWSWSTGFGKFHPCLSRLTPTGRLDGNFGLAGVCRHDGLGEANLVTVDRSGRVWCAGIRKSFDGTVPGPTPSPPRTKWLPRLAVSRVTPEGEIDGGFGLAGTSLTGPFLGQSVDYYDASSLVPLTAGGALVAGGYGTLNVDMNGNISLAFLGSWMARLTSTGDLDPAFGTAGVRSFPARDLHVEAELADGSLHGWERLGNDRVPMRLTPAADAAPGFGATGTKPIGKPIVTLPSRYEPSGEWYAPTFGTNQGGNPTIGLVRCQPDGTIDQSFGAGAAAPPPDRFISVSSIRGEGFGTTSLQALNPTWWQDVEGGPHQTIRLADASYLTLWTVTWQEGARTPSGLALLAWTAAGLPRPTWGGLPAKVIANPTLSLASSGRLAWRFRCALLQADGSILVGLSGDDPDMRPVGVNSPLPAWMRSSAYFGRLRPSTYDFDPAFSGGYIVPRLPGDDRELGGRKMVDHQIPVALGSVGGSQVVAAISCQTGWDPPLGVDSFSSSPDLLADGSVGVVRLI